jgi:uncharacterized protein (DUF58 family)
MWRLTDGLGPGGGSTGTGSRRQRSVPRGGSFADVREYVVGDDLRTVHWPTTAHRGRLMVRRTESDQSPRALVLLDTRAERHVGRGPAASIETVVSAAASIGQHLHSRGRALTLLDRPLAAETAARPWEHWLQVLVDAQPGSVDFAGLLTQVGHGRAGDGTLVAIVTTPDPAELRLLVRAGRGFSTRIAVVVNVGAPPRGHRGTDPEEVVASLRTAGWRAVAIRAGEPIDDRWRQLIAQRRQPVRA